MWLQFHDFNGKRIRKGQSEMENPEKKATKTQHNMCWTPLYANKEK